MSDAPVPRRSARLAAKAVAKEAARPAPAPAPPLSVEEEDMQHINRILHRAMKAPTRKERMPLVEQLFLYLVLHPTIMVLTPRLRAVVQNKLQETNLVLGGAPLEEYKGLQGTVQALQLTLQAITHLPQYVP